MSAANTVVAAASGSSSHNAGRSPAARASPRAAPAASAQSVGERMKRPDRPAVHVASGVGERESGVGIEPRLAFDQHRLGRVGGLAHVSQRQGGRAFAAKQQCRLFLRVEQRERFGRGGFDRKNRDRFGAIDANRATGPKRGDRPADAIVQISISQIRGTWSDGRSHIRHGSSTSWAAR